MFPGGHKENDGFNLARSVLFSRGIRKKTEKTPESASFSAEDFSGAQSFVIGWGIFGGTPKKTEFFG